MVLSMARMRTEGALSEGTVPVDCSSSCCALPKNKTPPLLQQVNGRTQMRRSPLTFPHRRFSLRTRTVGYGCRAS
ncbi:Uncharacterized protein DAT39_020764 [Clarias magur]|uniref:Uncharacterized protein n=1 Tax=Clarias magur TaxID=1594786 RepID=A0A8J4U2E6_CLAMG|nr:Uncharacterized protein DAT39_020764 [Clarias magur]